MTKDAKSLVFLFAPSVCPKVGIRQCPPQFPIRDSIPRKTSFPERGKHWGHAPVSTSASAGEEAAWQSQNPQPGHSCWGTCKGHCRAAAEAQRTPDPFWQLEHVFSSLQSTFPLQDAVASLVLEAAPSPASSRRDEYGTHRCLSTVHFHSDLTDLLENHLDVPLLIHPAGLAPCRLCVLPALCSSHVWVSAVPDQQLQILARQHSWLFDESFSNHNQSLPPLLLFPDSQLRSYLQVHSVERKLRYYLPKYLEGLRNLFSPCNYKHCSQVELPFACCQQPGKIRI